MLLRQAAKVKAWRGWATVRTDTQELLGAWLDPYMAKHMVLRKEEESKKDHEVIRVKIERL